MNLGPWWKGVLRFRCGHLQEVACPIDCMQTTVKSNTPGGQGRCEDLCSACEASALLQRLPKRFEFNEIRHRCGHGVEGARRYADADAADSEAEVEMGADDEMAELLEDVADSRCSTCLESAGFEAPSVEL